MNHTHLQQSRDYLQQIGDRGEDAVLRYELSRLVGHPRLREVRIAGRSDISLGYDILSFEGPNSTMHDRYIEVKTYSGSPHFFLSQGEYDAATRLGNRYYLYLVDEARLTDPDFCPIIIADPMNHLTEESS